MKTRTALFFVLAFSLSAPSAQQNLPVTGNKWAPRVVTELNQSNNTVTQPFLVTRSYRVTSARTFMPFTEDPCNHLPSRNAVC